MQAEPLGAPADYSGGGIVNLVASIAAACSGGDLAAQPYPQLRGLDQRLLEDARHIVLFAVDGLGLDYLNRHGRGSCLQQHLQSDISSVFPSTTASAATCLLTGMAAQQHGLTGWHTYFREIGSVVAVLPLRPRHAGGSLVAAGVPAAALLSGEPLFGRLQRACHVVAPANIVDSDFNAYYAGPARRSGYQALEQCFAAIADGIRSVPGKSYTHAYYPVIDAAAHAFGCTSAEVHARFARLDRCFADFLAAIAGSDTAVIVTADHGFIDSPPAHNIALEDHPELARMLILPLCGELRLAYCYLRPHRQADFLAYVASEFAGRASAVPSADLLARGWFGLGPAHPRLDERIGDYTLIMHDDWTIADRLAAEPRHELLGVHGGVSAAEMRVPLIVAPA